MNKLPRQKILIELDCLLDTRIGTVAMISQDLATSVLQNNYHARMEDKFVGVDDVQFKEMYNNRTLDVLKHSTVTTFMPLLKHLCSQIFEESLSRPFHSGPEVIVNIYPYFMSGDVADDIKEAICRWLGVSTLVSITRIEPQELIPIVCREYSLMVMYDPTLWVNMNLENLLKTNLREVCLYIPKIYRNKDISDEELEQQIEQVMDPFIALDFLLKPLIDLTQLDVGYFSILNPKELIDFNNFRFSSVKEG